MLIQVGHELVFNCPQATPMILVVNVHYSRASDILVPDCLTTDPETPITAYRDGFGNWCTRIVAPVGRIRLKSTGVVRDSGETDVVTTSAQQHSLQDLPEDTLVFLLGSRYCETDLLSWEAWSRFGQTTPGWSGVKAICDFVHNDIAFDYQQARPTRTAWEAFNEGMGVCRDYAHLAIALCRSMNIPARYCTGYLGDMGTLPPYGLMDFQRGLKSISVAPGSRSIHGTTCPGLDECSSLEAVTRPMSPSRPRSAKIRSRALKSGRMKSRKICRS